MVDWNLLNKNILYKPASGKFFITLEIIKHIGKYFLPVLISMILLGSCKSHNNLVERGFYFWKTTYSLSQTGAIRLHKLNITKIYLRLFDVDWDKVTNSAIPAGEIKFDQKPDSTFAIVPVAFITNRTLLNLNINDSPQLADKIFSKINQIMKFNNIPFRELQLDCDWTERYGN